MEINRVLPPLTPHQEWYKRVVIAYNHAYHDFSNTRDEAKIKELADLMEEKSKLYPADVCARIIVEASNDYELEMERRKNERG